MPYRKHLKDQVFWYSSANYIGFALSFFASIFLYPNNLEFLGEVRYIETIGQFLFPILLFGLPQALVKFSPQMHNYHLPRFCGMSFFIVTFLSVFVYILITIIHHYKPFSNYTFVLYGFVLAVCYAFIDLVKSRAITLQKVKIPIFIEKVLPKIALPILFILLIKNSLSKDQSMVFYLLFYIILVLGLFVYLSKYSLPIFSTKYYFLFENYSVSEFLKFSFYAFLGSLGALVAFRIDNFMIPQFLSMENNGIYSVALNISGLIGVPMAGVFALHSPIIAQLIENKNIEELEKKYTETATFLFWIGAIFFTLLLVSTPFITQIFTTHALSENFNWVVLLLGFSMLINMGTGFNSEIISFSKHYRFNLLTLFVLVVTNVVLNYYFLSQTNLKLVGVAIASTLSMTLYNLVKLWYVYKKFKILPFDMHYLYVMMLSVAVAVFTFALPNFTSYTATILYKGIFIFALNIYFAYKFNLINKVKLFIDEQLEKQKKRNKK